MVCASKSACIALSSARSCPCNICPDRLSTACLVSLVVFSFVAWSLVVTREVHRSSLRQLICPVQDLFIFLTLLIMFMAFIPSLTQMLVLLSLCLMLSILLSILVCAVANLFCACLVSVQVSAPYVIAGGTQELYTCLFRHIYGEVAFEDIPVFGVCRSGCHDFSLYRQLLIAFNNNV